MIEEIKRKVIEKLKSHPKRLEHVLGVYETAIKIAKAHHLDEGKIAIAALYHDYAKYDSIEDQIAHLDLETIKDYVDTPVIYHAFAAAKSLELEFKVFDEDVLNAMRYHVWGRIGMSDIEKVILISDSCEPNRKFDDANYIYQLALRDLDLACEYVMKASIDYIKTKGLVPAKEQVEAYIYYMEVNRGKTE
ncbi:MAG: bis(5'-nucleosyl)-tetraphosphatase (symmetrical) YqeK [Firmicutes bacterium]|nr:bis(5'-nucleosyl)-tetraphosphatase (symmetrical) YqeK [Bacillota bacterium]